MNTIALKYSKQPYIAEHMTRVSQIYSRQTNGTVPTESDIKSLSFRVTTPNGDNKASLIHCFLHEVTVTPGKILPFLVANDGLVYIAVWDFDVFILTEETICIGSYQKHTFGNFVILRIKREN